MGENDKLRKVKEVILISTTCGEHAVSIEHVKKALVENYGIDEDYFENVLGELENSGFIFVKNGYIVLKKK